jgi:hypothetical protein
LNIHFSHFRAHALYSCLFYFEKRIYGINVHQICPEKSLGSQVAPRIFYHGHMNYIIASLHSAVCLLNVFFPNLIPYISYSLTRLQSAKIYFYLIAKFSFCPHYFNKLFCLVWGSKGELTGSDHLPTGGHIGHWPIYMI